MEDHRTDAGNECFFSEGQVTKWGYSPEREKWRKDYAKTILNRHPEDFLSDCHKWYDENVGLPHLLGCVLEKEGFDGCVSPLNTIFSKLEQAFEDLRLIVTGGTLMSLQSQEARKDSNRNGLCVARAQDGCDESPKPQTETTPPD